MQDSKRNRITGKALALPGNDIDTDRIIPARFLRCVTFDGLGEHAFEDDRKQLAQAGQTHPFDAKSATSAEILVVGRNFGCGSSREHAPQALMRFGKGLRAVVGESFAEIFFGNCVALGIPCVTLSASDLAALTKAIQADVTLDVTVDLDRRRVSAGTLDLPCSIAEGPREQLASGRWDTTGELIDDLPSIARTASALPYFSNW